MKDKQYYIQLTDRYFEAETSTAEERELREFLASTDEPEFDEIKAVMGVMLVASKPKLSSKKTRAISMKPLVAAVAAVAAVALLLIVFVPFIRGQHDDCVMYVNGEKTTDNQEVMSVMKGQMAQMLDDSGDTYSMENQMADMLN